MLETEIILLFRMDEDNLLEFNDYFAIVLYIQSQEKKKNSKLII